MDPAELNYTTTHEWIYAHRGVATVGITEFAVRALTDLVYIDLPDVGRMLGVGEAFGEVESVKAVSELCVPVAGKVIEVNESLPDELDILSEDPYGRGWMIKLKISEPAALHALFDLAAYQEHCTTDSH